MPTQGDIDAAIQAVDFARQSVQSGNQGTETAAADSVLVDSRNLILAIPADPAPPFDPTAILGCKIWLTNSQPWQDQSGNGNHPSISGQPTYGNGSGTLPNRHEVICEQDTRISLPRPKSLSASGQWALAFVFRPILLYGDSDSNGKNDNHFVFNETTNGTEQSISLVWGDNTSQNRWRLAARNSAGAFFKQVIESSVYPVHHRILLTYDGDSYRLFFNDWESPIATLNVPTEMVGNGELFLGSHPTANSGSCRGAFGDVILYDSIPTQAELDSLNAYLANRWPVKTTRLGDRASGAHNIPNAYRTASIKPNPNGTHHDMVCVHESTSQLHWFQALNSNPHNWTHQNGGQPIFNPPTQCRGTSHVWFGGMLYVYYEDRAAGEIRLLTGPSFANLTDLGVILSHGSLYYRHPSVWVNGGEVYLLVDVREDSPAGADGYIAATKSANGQTDWTPLNTVLDHSVFEDGIADDLGAPSVLVLDEQTNKIQFAFAGYNKQYGHPLYGGAHPGWPHSIWLAEVANPIVNQAVLVHDHAIMAGRIGAGSTDCYAHNSPEFYPVGGSTFIYVDGQDQSLSVKMVLFEMNGII